MNAVSSTALLDVIAQSSRGGGRGAALYLTSRQGMVPRYDLTEQQRQFIADLAEMPKRELRPAHPHPGRRTDVNVIKRGDGPLTPVEIVWLQSLPADPAQLTEDDAVALGTLARTVAHGTPDARLVNAKWRPVAQFHDVAEREVNEANAKVPLPQIPSSALGALADAIAAERPDLNHSEAVDRASTAIDDAITQQAVATARASLAAMA